VGKHTDLLEIVENGIDSVRPSTIFPSLFAAPPLEELKIWLAASERFLLCIGKASIQSAETILSGRACSGVFIISPANTTSTRLPSGAIHYGAHPVPDERSIAAGRDLLMWLDQLPENEPLLVIISGGTSALMVAPVQGVSPASKFLINDRLIGSGAAIREINTVRKHLSAIKGGRLAPRIGNRPSLVLVISDVIGDDLATIGSGPFYPDHTTYLEAREILIRYDLWMQTPEDVRQTIEDGVAGKISETPKPGTASTPHYVVASNRIARLAAAAKARDLGYRVELVEEPVEGLVTSVVEKIFTQIAQAPAGTAVVMGGETTVQVRGNGTGGRNQHLALLMVERLARKDIIFVAAGTDGIDGNSTAAGAWVDGRSKDRAEALRLSIAYAKEQFDSCPFFQQLGQSIVTGHTGTNVMDLYIALT